MNDQHIFLNDKDQQQSNAASARGRLVRVEAYAILVYLISSSFMTPPYQPELSLSPTLKQFSHDLSFVELAHRPRTSPASRPAGGCRHTTPLSTSSAQQPAVPYRHACIQKKKMCGVSGRCMHTTGGREGTTSTSLRTGQGIFTWATTHDWTQGHLLGRRNTKTQHSYLKHFSSLPSPLPYSYPSTPQPTPYNPPAHIPSTPPPIHPSSSPRAPNPATTHQSTADYQTPNPALLCCIRPHFSSRNTACLGRSLRWLCRCWAKEVRKRNNLRSRGIGCM